MIYVLDSNAVRDLMDDHAVARARLAAVRPPDVVAACSIVRGEVLFGIERLAAGQRRDRIGARAAVMFASVAEQSVPFSAGDHYARLKRQRQIAGLPMDENDLWIAATALALGAVLVSRDTDFQNTSRD